LDHITRVDASSDFNGTANVPKIAITMGFTILLSKRIVLLAWGQNKADIIKEQFRKTSALKFPTVLQNHANTTLF
jgi:glucosamine-6-phosphate deaminase